MFVKWRVVNNLPRCECVVKNKRFIKSWTWICYLNLDTEIYIVGGYAQMMCGLNVLEDMLNESVAKFSKIYNDSIKIVNYKYSGDAN